MGVTITMGFTLFGLNYMLRPAPQPITRIIMTAPPATVAPTATNSATRPLDDGKLRFGQIVIAPDLLKLDPQRLVDALPVHNGSPFSLERLEATNDALMSAAGVAGFVSVDVVYRYQIDASSHLVNVTFDLTEGSKAYVKKIDVFGDSRQLHYTTPLGQAANVESQRAP